METFVRINTLPQVVLYEVNIRQYTKQGNFKSFATHLPRLKQMGVNTLWFMPITPISQQIRQGTLGSYYACSSYTQINSEYGDIEDFKYLVQCIHNLGMQVIIDWVANHTGWDHHWTIEHPDFYIKDEQGNFTEKNGWHDVIDLDYNNPLLQTKMIEAMQFWINTCNIDGFRCDMAHLVPLSFWKKARTACDNLKPLLWLAECDTAEYAEVFDITYAWNWMHETEKISKQPSNLAGVLHTLYTYQQNSINHSTKLFFTSNHDENSWNGTEYEKYGKAAPLWSIFSFLWPGTPLIYSGQEIPNHKRLAFFDKDELNWNTPIQLHDFYQQLSALKQSNAIANGSLTVLSQPTDRHLAFLRHANNQTVLVLLNFSEQAINITLPLTHFSGLYRSLKTGFSYTLKQHEQFTLTAFDWVVYHQIPQL